MRPRTAVVPCPHLVARGHQATPQGPGDGARPRPRRSTSSRRRSWRGRRVSVFRPSATSTPCRSSRPRGRGVPACPRSEARSQGRRPATERSEALGDRTEAPRTPRPLFDQVAELVCSVQRSRQREEGSRARRRAPSAEALLLLSRRLTKITRRASKASETFARPNSSSQQDAEIAGARAPAKAR